LGDLLYVVYGAGVTCGIDLEQVFEEIHRSNMSKVGGYKNAIGKFVKPSTYSPADLRPILLYQGALL
jgi:predicted HAD superfamily Cof-like phosphohydrolase